MTTRVVVVGAGITGLTAALTLLDVVQGIDLVVVESSQHVGGKIRTGLFAGHQVDEAADAFLARVPEGIALCERLGLRESLVAPAARTAYLYSRGQLHRFPEGLMLGIPTDLDALAASGVVSAAGVARAGQDLTMGPDPAGQADQSVGALVRRRLGDEIYDVLVGPLLSGVNAGNADWLSVAAGAPQFEAAMREHGSLIAGARAQRQSAAASNPQAPVFFGLPTGMHDLIAALHGAVLAAGGRVHRGRTVSSIERADSDSWILGTTDGKTYDADAVVLTTPLFVTSQLVADLVPDVAVEMGEVEYSSPTMVTLAVPKALIDHPLDASGFLVSASEGLVLTACSWASSKWAHLDSDTTAILRASAGRHHDDRAEHMSDSELVATLLAELAVTMGLDGSPSEVRINRWPDSLPQFRPGHLDRVQRWHNALAAIAPGLVATGAGFEGLGLPACIRQATTTAKTLAKQAF